MIIAMEGEEWVPVERNGTVGVYEVSSLGRVACVDTSRRQGGPIPFLLTQRINMGGYPFVRLRGETVTVHRLVLNAFRGPRQAGMVSRHLNGDRTDARLCNLAYGTQMENVADTELHGRVLRGESHGSAKLTASNVVEIRRSPESQSDLAKRFGVSISAINHIRCQRSWRCLLEAA